MSEISLLSPGAEIARWAVLPRWAVFGKFPLQLMSRKFGLLGTKNDDAKLPQSDARWAVFGKFPLYNVKFLYCRVL